ncbi:hypothetical protein HQ45_04000 [Porphyromonas crevioricanis]|uniref:NAD-dependent protein deacylase n=2 Tax=Porphyromonas crevioricanis TaxID=393921 RepID=A0A0A2FG84_9PORP|nr:NAD-dependent deacylase [Porphyromonas crevioricanis]KGN89993.1 hypothetical protein HQ45_04000 [Porphyromonas crevioricanis]SJZ67937.1 NAD-dependent deacetylase [Porphyromonas crevioricanis]SQH73990.1 NAD-dependent deacetylase [Porphyromonas crevioricanis]GAD04614.1 NAD-dependent protein deacetylase of SIR2 family [Porphyromonas crevioricanis JCM 15906]GAD07227.1 NAD-dependent protein deacetylase of SIR2 family [Porphyromonas crevioricanis JCM 13913]
METKKKARLVVLTGAGMSAESGISTFRDSNGLWENHRVEDVASIEGFERNPELVLDFYNARRRAYKGCDPNEGHRILAQLEEQYEVKIITQNVDDLHERAGSSSVIHLHGELMKNRSVRTDRVLYDVDLDNPDLHVGDLAPDGSQLRPFIVWFGEPVPMIEPAIQLAQTADIFVVVGTSLVVYPAAGLLNYVPRGCPIYLIDPQPVAATRAGVQHIQAKATTGLAQLRAVLLNRQ